MILYATRAIYAISCYASRPCGGRLARSVAHYANDRPAVIVKYASVIITYECLCDGNRGSVITDVTVASL